ncbi:hypothetical protein ANCDUO_16973, partial [Ancylostoma duodenale]
MSGEVEVDADVENHHAHNSDRKRPLKNGELNGAVKVRRISVNSTAGASEPKRGGKSALFASLNIGLGGRGNNNDRGNSVKSYIKEGRKRYQTMVEERRRLRGIQEMRNQQSTIGWMLLWCPLRDVLEKIQILEKKREKFVEESEHLQKRIQETSAKKDELIVEASSVRQKINEEGDVLQTLKGKMRSGESKI